jgi:subtilisin family serine protease
VYFGGMTIDEYATNSSTVYGHPNSRGAQAVGAARYTQTPAFGISPPKLEYFSSTGGTPILFDTLGATTFELRQKPEIVAPNGGDNTFFGSDYEGNGWPNFFGTSAAAPHAAGVAALMQSLDPDVTPGQIYSALQDTATEMDAPGPDFNSGFGLVQAAQAMGSLIAPIAITTSSLPGGKVDDYYLQALTAEGGLAPYSWSLLDGSLPPGIVLESSGLLNGTPTDYLASPYAFTVQVSDALGSSVNLALSIAVEDCDCGTGGGCH